MKLKIVAEVRAIKVLETMKPRGQHETKGSGLEKGKVHLQPFYLLSQLIVRRQLTRRTLTYPGHCRIAQGPKRLSDFPVCCARVLLDQVNACLPRLTPPTFAS
jgi:hypothetical protein